MDNCSLSGRTKAGSYGYGDRVERIPYLIVNINNATFTRGGNLFRTIGYFDANMLYTVCDTSVDASCSRPIYNTADNSLSSDSPVSVHMGFSTQMSNAMIFLASMFMCITALCMIIVTYYRNDFALKALQPLRLPGTLLGCVILALSLSSAL